MNPSIVALLALGAVGIAVAASSDGNSGPADTPPGPKSELLTNAETMVRIYEFYRRKYSTLNDDERAELGQLNAAAKGVEWISEVDWGHERGLFTTHNELYFHGVWGHYNNTYYLPPGVPDMKGPDVFTAWLDTWNPWLKCTGTVLVGREVVCSDGTYYDGFFRVIGYYHVDNVVKGKSDLSDIGEGLAKQFSDLWKAVGPGLLKAVASVASNYPGVGTAISVALTFVAEVGSGASLGNASLESAKAAVPSSIRGVYDLGVGLATTGELDPQQAATVAMAFAISTGALDGQILERYETIKKAYDDATAAGVGIQNLEIPVSVATG